MDFLRAIVGFLVIVGLALLLGYTRHAKHPATHFYVFLCAISTLLLLRFFL